MSERSLAADIGAIGDFLRMLAREDSELTVKGVAFLLEAVDEITLRAQAFERDFAREERARISAEARVASLELPALATALDRDLAIAQGRRSGAVIDLREVFQRELRDHEEPGDAA